MFGAGVPWVLTALFAAVAAAALAVYRDGAGEAVVLPMVGYAAALPILSVLSRDWWAFAAQMSVAFVIAFVGVLIGLEAVGAAEKMGPAGMAYLFPVLLFMLASAVAGAVRLAFMGVRQAGGRRDGRPFISRSAIRNMAIVATAAVSPFALSYVLGLIEAAAG
ncbi:MAG: hypothetical protein HXY23_11110 [Parvularculaceae bacterium]|nr:hypothetical protein [Parvularculaceae bacterium]